jgi:riboflavin kinase/FMN adenylyltransferase
MRVFRGIGHAALLRTAPRTAVTIGTFDGVHRGHQAMLALLASEASHRGLPATVVTFEPHPRDWFARLAGRSASTAGAHRPPTRICTLRDKLSELARCGIAQAVVLRFDERLASLTPEAFVDEVLVRGLAAGYVLVGDDFRFGARRAGDYARLDALGASRGFDVARMMSYEVHGVRVSSSALRAALAAGDMAGAEALLGRPYGISGHVLHGARLGRTLGASADGRTDGFRTLNLRFPHPHPAASGIFTARVHGLGPTPLDAVASLGTRPTVDGSGRVLLETHVLDWPGALGDEGGYGRLVRVDLLAKLRDEARYDTLATLADAIGADVAAARAWFAAHERIRP